MFGKLEESITSIIIFNVNFTFNVWNKFLIHTDVSLMMYGWQIWHRTFCSADVQCWAVLIWCHCRWKTCSETRNAGDSFTTSWHDITILNWLPSCLCRMQTHLDFTIITTYLLTFATSKSYSIIQHNPGHSWATPHSKNVLSIDCHLCVRVWLLRPILARDNFPHCEHENLVFLASHCLGVSSPIGFQLFGVLSNKPPLSTRQSVRFPGVQVNVISFQGWFEYIFIALMLCSYKSLALTQLRKKDLLG